MNVAFAFSKTVCYFRLCSIYWCCPFFPHSSEWPSTIRGENNFLYIFYWCNCMHGPLICISYGSVSFRWSWKTFQQVCFYLTGKNCEMHHSKQGGFSQLLAAFLTALFGGAISIILSDLVWLVSKTVRSVKVFVLSVMEWNFACWWK